MRLTQYVTDLVDRFFDQLCAAGASEELIADLTRACYELGNGWRSRAIQRSDPDLTDPCLMRLGGRFITGSRSAAEKSSDAFFQAERMASYRHPI